MDDFYVYYHTDQANPKTGVIKAIAPIELPNEMGDMMYLRISAERGKEFTIGTECITNWVIQWDADAGAMALVKQEAAVRNLLSAIIGQISHIEENPEITVDYNRSEKRFVVEAPGMSAGHPNVKMIFFVTAKDDPHILYFNFTVDLYTSKEEGSATVECDVELPDEFSVITRCFFDRYLLRINP